MRPESVKEAATDQSRPLAAAPPGGSPGVGDDPLWYKDAIIYQVHVKSFRDSTGDGYGDFKGLIEKLDYVQSLGVTAVLSFAASR
jgi:maltose alpha-D-glucosyltransferase/alpha-amylase